MDVVDKNVTTQKDTSNETSVSSLIRNLCKASRQSGSGALVAKLLEHRKKHSPGWRVPLLAEGSNNERLVYERLFSKQLLTNNNDTNIWEQLVHALLVSPSSYETPWRTACDVVKFCLVQYAYTHDEESKNDNHHRVSETSFRSCITNIQSFLQQAVVCWCEEERKRSLGQQQPAAAAAGAATAQCTAHNKNPSDWMVELVIHVIQPLLENSKSDRIALRAEKQLSNDCSSNNKRDKQWTMIPLPLIPMIVSMAKDLDASFFQSVLDHIYHKEHKIRSDRLLDWINLSSDLRLYLRPQDWQWIQVRMEQNLSACSQAQLPDFTQGLLALCLTLLRDSLKSIDRQKQQECRKRLRAWQELLLELFWLTSADETLFSKVESTCSSRLLSLSPAALEQWASVLSSSPLSSAPEAASLTDSNQTNNTRPSWVDACLWLMVWRAAEQQKTAGGAQLVSHLMTRALLPVQPSRRKKEGVLSLDVADCCWKQLVRLTGIRLDQSTSAGAAASSSSSSSKTNEDCLQRLKRLFLSCRYQGRGKFSGDEQSGWENSWTRAGKLVFLSLVLGNGDMPQTRDSSPFSVQTLERAQVWVTSANKVLLSNTGHNSVEKATAVIVLVTLYSEMPMCRPSIEQCILQAFSQDFGTGTQCFAAARFYCIVLSCLIQSALNDSSQSPIEMERISQVLTEPLPMDLFVDVVQVLLPVVAARRLLLSSSQKAINTCELSLLHLHESNDDGTTRHVLELQRCLYALVALTCASSWDKTEEDAWLLLSSILMDRQVQLPFSMRCWLFATLRQQVKKGCISRSVSLRLLRCCVSRLLDFIGPDEDSFQTFCPERAFIFRRNGLPPKIVEDLVGLVGLVLELIYLALSGGSDLLGKDVKELTMSWHEFFLQRLCVGPKINSFDLWTTATKLHQFEDETVLPFTVTMYCLSLMLQSLLCHPSSSKVGNTTSPKTLQGMLEKQEVGGREDHDNLQRWVGLSPQIVRARKEVTLLSDALSDLLIEYFVSPRWPWSTKNISPQGEHAVLIRMGFILAAKRRLQEVSSNSTYVPVTHHEDMLRTYTILLQDQCRFLKNTLKKETQDRNMIDLLNMVADTCDLGRICCEKIADDTLSKSWLAGLHKVYDGLSNESSSIHLISVLEKACAFNEIGERTSNANKADMFPEFRTVDDVDMYVRAIRLSLTRAISSATSVVLRPIDAHKAGNDGLVGVEDFASKSNDQKFLEILLSFCNDLHLGVEGESGGLSSDLFQSYLDCIDKTALLIAHNLFAEPDQSTPVSSETLSRLGRTAESLEKIVKVVSGDKASPFKGLIGILTYSLPFLARSLVCAGDSTNSLDELHILIGRRSFRLRLFKDCASTLAGLSKTYGYVWWREKAMETLFDGEDGDSHRRLDQNGDKGAGRLDPIRGYEEERLCSFDLPDEKVWSRAFVMATQGFENDFNDVISSVLLRELQCLPSTTVSQSFVRLRVKEFSEYICALSRPLEKVTPQIVTPQGVIDLTSPANGGNMSMEKFRICAMSLPPAVKSRYSLAVDRFLTMLNLSIKKLCDIIKSFDGSKELEGNSRSLMEALSVFTGWLTAEMPDGAIDIGLGVRRWQHAERVHFEDCVSKSKSFTSEDNVLKKLPRMEQKVDEFESHLEELSDLVKDEPETNQRSGVVPKMNALLGSEGRARNILQLLSVKTKKLNKQQQLLEKDIGVIRKEPSRGKGKRKITEELERRAKKERSRQTIRSRNSVVDEWLEIDRDNEDKGGDNDAFADLEDFLVPG